MTNTPEKIIDVIKNLAAAGIEQRLALMGADTTHFVSNLELPWRDDIAHEFRRWRESLAPRSLLFFTTFGPDTLKEWPDQAAIKVKRIDMHDMGDWLVQAGLCDPVMEVEHYTMRYGDTAKLLQEVQESELAEAAIVSGNEVTFEIVYGHAWVPAKEVEISLASLRSQLKNLA